LHDRQQITLLLSLSQISKPSKPFCKLLSSMVLTRC
jgi:hypothetical protein